MESKQANIPALAAAAFGAVVTLVSDHLTTGKDMMETTHLIPIQIVAFSFLGIVLFCTSQVLPSNNPVIAAFCELVGILSVGLFISSLVSIIVLPGYGWLVYTIVLLSFLPLLNKPVEIVYSGLSQRLVSAYRHVMHWFYPAQELGIVES